MAVMNMAEEMVDVWKAVFMTYAPVRSSKTLGRVLKTPGVRRVWQGQASQMQGLLGNVRHWCTPGCPVSSDLYADRLGSE